MLCMAQLDFTYLNGNKLQLDCTQTDKRGLETSAQIYKSHLRCHGFNHLKVFLPQCLKTQAPHTLKQLTQSFCIVFVYAPEQTSTDARCFFINISPLMKSLKI